MVDGLAQTIHIYIEWCIHGTCWSGFQCTYGNIHCRVDQFEVRPKVWVCELSCILTNLKSAVRSSVDKLFKSSLSITACVCQNC